MDGAEARDPHPAIWASDMPPMSRRARRPPQNPGREPAAERPSVQILVAREVGKTDPNFGKRIGSEGLGSGVPGPELQSAAGGMARGCVAAARSVCRRVPACGTDRERPPLGGLPPGVEQPTQN
uniref:Uncharacterized protein n=1 Tax=Zea mays TaxID=4577 RepID=A0A804UN90_MAIZE